MIETLSNFCRDGNQLAAVDTHSFQFGQGQGVDNGRKIYQLINFFNLPNLEKQSDGSGSSEKDQVRARE